MGWGKKFSILLIDDHLKVPQIAEIWTFSILIYLIVCSYWSLFTMRMFGKFALRAHQNSSDLCLITSAIYQSRVQFSLSFNFLLLLNQHQITKRTAFHHFFQEIQVVHFFGTEFSVYAPILMIILAGFTLTNGYAHVMKNIGIEQYTELILGNTEHETQILQGETLVRKGIEKYQAICSNKKKKKKNFFFSTNKTTGSSSIYTNDLAFSNESATESLLLHEEANASNTNILLGGGYQ
jgi:hypothetical protein